MAEFVQLYTIRVWELNVLNVVHNKNYTFKLLVTLWILGKKLQAKALIDSGATTSFINKDYIKKHQLTILRLATSYEIKNADGTSNKQGQITHTIHVLIQIETHKHS